MSRTFMTVGDASMSDKPKVVVPSDTDAEMAAIADYNPYDNDTSFIFKDYGPDGVKLPFGASKEAKK